MYKLILATIISATLALYPVSAGAPATGGFVEQPIKIAQETTIEPTNNDNFLVDNEVLNVELDLIMPIGGPSIHTNYTGPVDGFHWKDQNSGQYHVYGVEDGKFIHQTGDTWFIYGLFGPIKATKYDWNIQYDLWNGNHNGIDFVMPLNTPILAASGGEVIFTGVSAGNTIVVKKGNFHITYSHLNSISVEVGESITQGQTIGFSGDSGTINPHLHFQIDEYKLDGTKWGINPAKFLPQLDLAIVPNTPTNQLISEVNKFIW